MENLTSQQLIDYFKDVFELEKQLYTYKEIEKKYLSRLKWIAVPRILRIGYLDNLGEKVRNSEIIYEHMTPVIYDSHDLDNVGINKPEWKETEEFREIIKRGKFKLFNKATTMSLELKDYYHRCMDNESKMIAQSEIPLRNHMEKELNELVIKPKEEVKRMLDNLYSQDIIFPKYRNFAAVAQIYEYLVCGRCTELKGPDGAYNLYESELRQNIIIDKLDTIIGQLESLNRTMSTMCNAIQTTNRLLGNISMTLGRIEANTALTAYNSQCIAHNTRIASQYVL